MDIWYIRGLALWLSKLTHEFQINKNIFKKKDNDRCCLGFPYTTLESLDLSSGSTLNPTCLLLHTPEAATSGPWVPTSHMGDGC